MNIAVIGGGFTGLTAAYKLTGLGHNVTVIERDRTLGGLANGWKEKNWDWYLEKAYHHFFTNDHTIIALVKELGIANKLIIKRPVTANFLSDGTTAQLDSPIHLLRFPGLSFPDKLKTGAVAAFCKIYPFWQPLEGITAKKFFTSCGGSAGWRTIWEPLMTGKFGTYEDSVAASWLWARIRKRTTSLCYIRGGFQTLVETLAQTIKKQGGVIHTGSTVTAVYRQPDRSYTVSWDKASQTFDTILLTVPTPVAYQLVPSIASAKPLTIPHLDAQMLILETTQAILKHTYWLSITDRSFPFLAVVAHTNFMDKRYYGNHHLTYIGNYLPHNHPYLSFSKEQLLTTFMPFVKRLCPSMDRTRIVNTFLFNAPYAQPVHQLHYSRRAPVMQTPLDGVYIANMDSIYPWDRGTNYAVELGQKAANKILYMYEGRRTQDEEK